MTYNLDSFCPEAWSQIEIDATGDYKICCLANYDKDFGMAVDKDGNVMNVLTHSIKEAMNSTTHIEHRLDMSKNIKPKRCRSCYDSEESTKGLCGTGNHGDSKRQRVIQSTAVDNFEYVTVYSAKDLTSADGTLKNPKVINLDLRFGNLCNQKCIMCSPQHSSLWYDDWISISNGAPQYNRDIGIYKKGETKTFNFYKDAKGKTRMEGAVPWWETDVWWKQFDEVAPDLRYIYFTGGEPLVVPAMQECLDRLIARGYSKNIQLRYDTNLSVINDKVISKWKHFKKVFLCVSIDDTGDRYNLIRHPGNFDQISKNILQLKDAGIPIHYLSSCIGLASPYSVIRISQFAEELGISTYFRFLEGPDWLDIRNYPKSAKLEIIENLKKHSGDPLYDKWATAEINLLTKYIDHSEETHLAEFIRVMDILDSRRGTQWRTVLTDVVDLYKKHCPHLYKE
jgi:hypothetical protein